MKADFTLMMPSIGKVCATNLSYYLSPPW
jgi:hypothetical protein